VKTLKVKEKGNGMREKASDKRYEGDNKGAGYGNGKSYPGPTVKNGGTSSGTSTKDPLRKPLY
jgi:hypothetical protein